MKSDLSITHVVMILCSIDNPVFSLIAAGVNIFRPTSFYIIVQTSFGLQMEIQLVPIMQVYITVDVTHKQNLLGELNTYFTDNECCINSTKV